VASPNTVYMKNKKILWTVLRGLFLVLLVFSLYVFVVCGNEWLKIIQYPFNSEGSYFDPISGIDYHNGPFFAALGELIFSIVAFLTFLISLFSYKWATLRLKGNSTQFLKR
jgi:hypothetical protein